MPNIPDDDTPPPPERPIIRQAVAFSAAPAAVTVNTYEASIPAAPTHNIFFLPGQEVPKVKAKKRAAKKAKRTEEFASQTGRFRLESYDPSPASQPPIHFGNGPYNSLFRGTLPGGNAQRSESPAMSTSSGYPTSSTLSESTFSPSSSNKKRPKSISKPKTTTSKGKVAEPRPVASTSNLPPPSGPSSTIIVGNIPPVTQPGMSVDVSQTPISPHTRTEYSRSDGFSPATSNASNSYYRRNYEQDISHQDRQTSYLSPAPAEVQRPTQSYDNTPRRADPSQRTTQAVDQGPKRTSNLPVRMVTVLIQDDRSGVMDYQLAEVRVSLRTMEDPQLGYWADAKELCESLQTGPSRIDGPAKVYTLRGKYRQFFLRVSEDNVDEFITANLIINPDRTITAIVEEPRPPGRLPQPPKIPRDLHQAPSPSPEPLRRQDALSAKAQAAEGYQRRRLSPSFDDYDSRSDHDPKKRRTKSPSTSRDGRQTSPGGASSPVNSYHRTSEAETSRNKNTTSSLRVVDEDYDEDDDDFSDTPQPTEHYRRRDYDSPAPDEDPKELYTKITRAVQVIIEKEDDWPKYFQARAKGYQLAGVLKQYDFVQRMFDKYAGELAPFETQKYVIEKIHITSALNIDTPDSPDPGFASRCTETLNLLKLYGKNGSRYEDPDTMELLNDKTIPSHSERRDKRLRKLLLKADQRWKTEHPDGVSENSCWSRRSSAQGEGDRRLSIEHLAGTSR
ncbi:hypothetical protein BDQ12DRAFT_673598 [Crucibulum laeve]|uniref:Uncharacterized protein n=1 Tax=Crucibulum laeve TaxID=68775 RepID=A0A5C3MTT7_9AGAR|nr:hypothetical protein BDQ12DRAFT_673598 [Crucibulum laeve]